jgi:hypothetical protein
MVLIVLIEKKKDFFSQYTCKSNAIFQEHLFPHQSASKPLKKCKHEELEYSEILVNIE